MSETRVYSDPRCLNHSAPGFPDRPERLTAILEGLAARGRQIREPGDHQRVLEVAEAVHDPSYLARLARAVQRGDGLIDSADNPLSSGTWDAALAAASAALHAADWVEAGEERRALAVVRPPGHHAERDLAMGFCYLNNVALAAEALLGKGQATRLAIFDFDVHHGNGTQHLFEERADVVFASTHQYPFYPGSGAASERGVGEGEGATLNVPLAAGTGDTRYAGLLEEQVLPFLRAKEPEILLVSAGFDAWRRDPLGGLALTENAFENLGSRLAAVAVEVAGGRVLSVLEGGYDAAALSDLVEAYLRGLEG